MPVLIIGLWRQDPTINTWKIFDSITLKVRLMINYEQVKLRLMNNFSKTKILFGAIWWLATVDTMTQLGEQASKQTGSWGRETGKERMVRANCIVPSLPRLADKARSCNK